MFKECVFLCVCCERNTNMLNDKVSWVSESVQMYTDRIFMREKNSGWMKTSEEKQNTQHNGGKANSW